MGQGLELYIHTKRYTLYLYINYSLPIVLGPVLFVRFVRFIKLINQVVVKKQHSLQVTNLLKKEALYGIENY